MGDRQRVWLGQDCETGSIGSFTEEEVRRDIIANRRFVKPKLYFWQVNSRMRNATKENPIVIRNGIVYWPRGADDGKI